MLIAIKGISLIEMMVVLLLTSLLLMPLTQFLSQFTQSYLTRYRHNRVEHVLASLLLRLEKDLRRAGFSYQGEPYPPLILPTSDTHNTACLILRYDLNRNGQLEGITNKQSEWFGYRFKQGVIEMNRGVSHCEGKGWQKVIDSNELIIDQWRIALHTSTQSTAFFQIEISAHWATQANISQYQRRWVGAPNL